MAESAGLPPEAPLDRAWIDAHPLPQPEGEVDKNSRGRVLVIGGCCEVPGGVRLTGEAALRTGAGKVRIATVAPAALLIGVQMPEIAVLALEPDSNGDIDAARWDPAKYLTGCDAIAVGPAMSCRDQGSALVAKILDEVDCARGLVIDAAALMNLCPHADRLRDRGFAAVLTPHVGEMAALLECDADAIEADRAGAVRQAAQRYGAVVVLKGGTSLIAEPGGALYAYEGGNIGLATGGSGDVLAGITAALLARGCTALDAALWAVWLHGEAGRRCAEEIGPLGYLASELLGCIPQAMRMPVDE